MPNHFSDLSGFLEALAEMKEPAFSLAIDEVADSLKRDGLKPVTANLLAHGMLCEARERMLVIHYEEAVQ